jgi:hypothetical protein
VPEAGEESSMNRLDGGLPPRYRIALVRESEAPFTSYPMFHNSAELFGALREEFAALDRECFFVVTSMSSTI